MPRRWNRRSLTGAFSFTPFLVCSVLVCPAARADYTVTILNPSGYFFSGIGAVSPDGLFQAGGAGPIGGNGFPAAGYWNGSAESFVNLNPEGINYSSCSGVSAGGVWQSGMGFGPATGGDFVYHAFLWHGSAESVIDLNPTDAPQSFAYGISGDGKKQVGLIFVSTPDTGTTTHATIWNSSASDYIDLNGDAISSQALGISPNGKYQVGLSGADGAFWAGSSVLFTSLHSEGITGSRALSISDDGAWQGGYGSTPDGFSHALLWHGSGDSVRDLNPAGLVNSYINGISPDGRFAAGGGWDADNNAHAYLWNTLTGIGVDLNQYLPAGYTTGLANAVDSRGNVAGSSQSQAAIWRITGVNAPEPSSLFLLFPGIASAALIARKRKT